MSLVCASASCASDFFSNVFTKFVRLIRSAGLMIFSFISKLMHAERSSLMQAERCMRMHAERSAASCATAQYKPHFRFFGGSIVNMEYGLRFLFSSLQFFFNAEWQQVLGLKISSTPAGLFFLDTVFLHRCRMVQQKSLLEYKQGNWLFSDQLDDLEVHTATLPTEDRDFSLDWCLDSGASCHFCNDSTKFMSMKKCNISVSTAKKG